MLTRRDLVLTAAGTALLRAVPSRADAAAQTPLDALFARFADEMLVQYPERAT
jgi:hypothetical protein